MAAAHPLYGHAPVFGERLGFVCGDDGVVFGADDPGDVGILRGFEFSEGDRPHDGAHPLFGGLLIACALDKRVPIDDALEDIIGKDMFGADADAAGDRGQRDGRGAADVAAHVTAHAVASHAQVRHACLIKPAQQGVGFQDRGEVHHELIGDGLDGHEALG